MTSPILPKPVVDPLANLLHALYHRGMTIGPDDAKRVALVFRHSADWSRTRRVQALQALLGRSDEERQLIAELAPSLFVNGSEKTSEDAMPHPSSSSDTPPQPRQQKIGPAVSMPSMHPRTSLRPKIWLVVGCLLAGVAILLSWYQPDWRSVPVEQPVSEQQSEQDTKTVSISTNTEDKAITLCPVIPTPEWLRQIVAGMAAMLLLPVVRLFWRTRRLERQQHNLKQLSISEEARCWQAIPPAEVLSPWIPAASLRDAAFFMNSPSLERTGEEVNLPRSVEETLRRAGLPTLVFRKKKQQKPVCFIEDVAPTMAAWPGMGRAIVNALERQGSVVWHWFMDGTPERVSRHPNLHAACSLEQALTGQEACTLILYGNAATLDQRSRISSWPWLARLDQALWLHPAPQALWGRAARILSSRLRLVSLAEKGLDRLGEIPGVRPLMPLWHPPQGDSRGDRQRLSLLRTLLGEGAWRWLVAGALLNRVGLLHVRTWRGMAGLAFLRVEAAVMERVLALPEVTLLPDGWLILDRQLGETLLQDAKERDADLLSDCVAWNAQWVATQILSLPANSLARAEARITHARLLALDARRAHDSQKAIDALVREGLGRWLVSRAIPEEQDSWPVSIATASNPATPDQLRLAFSSLLVSLMLADLALDGRWLHERSKPDQPRFELQGEAILAPDSPLRFCDRHQLQKKVTIRLGDRKRELTAEPDPGNAQVWTLTWDTQFLAGHTTSAMSLPLFWSYPGMAEISGPNIELKPYRSHLATKIIPIFQSTANPTAMSELTTNMVFVFVPGGMFRMNPPIDKQERDSHEGPLEGFRVEDFWLGKYEVTQEQWRVLMGNNPSNYKECGASCPVEMVSWHDAQNFVHKMNQKRDGCTYRLPTEAEWEYACRSGGKPEKHCGGNDLDAMAWYVGNSGKTIHPVGQKAANGLGIHDMSGNVWEWTSSDWGTYDDSGKNHTKASSGGSLRVARGGSYYGGPDTVNSTARDIGTPDIRNMNLGFRLAGSCP
ncbi:MAG: formylglycine-generating enzyme family protein [Magnetococcales bacterium]|nr:formylglycine-generating enzyme family protein [Magnetococcales bacterium]